MRQPAEGTCQRRQFLKRAAAGGTLAAAAPYVITSTALGDDRLPPASERIALGNIGIGQRGGGHLGLGGRLAQVVAVCDPWQDRRENAAKRCACRGYADFRELLARDDVDAVVIATPDHWHVPIALAAAKAGKDIFLEKALGTSIAEDLALREAVKRYGSVFQYGPQRRASGNYRRGCELVRNGHIGEIREIHITAMTYGACAPRQPQPAPVPPGFDYDLWLGPAPEAPYVPGRCKARGWYCIYDYCIGWISAWGSHVLSIAQWGYDTHRAGIVEFEGTGTIADQGLNDNLVNWDVRAQYANGLKMTFKTGGNGVKFVGTEGSVLVSDRKCATEPESLWESPSAPEDIQLGTTGNLGHDFVACVMTRGPTVSPIDDAVYSDVISHLADIAIRTGRKITWDPVKEEIIGDPEASRMLTRTMREPWQL